MIPKMKSKILCFLSMSLAVLYCTGLVAAACRSAAAGTVKNTAGSSTGATRMGYEDQLFDSSTVHSIHIKIKDADWKSLKDNALTKEYYACDVVVDGETFRNVGIRTKGNSTLVESIARDWDRYSLVVNFGKFNESQRYYGLDKLSLYNNSCDSSDLRDTLSLDMMRSMGIATPLCSHTAVYLNGEYLGLYTAIEGVDESFAYRNFGGSHGQLYKPEQYDASALLLGEKTNIVIDPGALSAGGDSLEISDLLQVSDAAVGLQYQGDELSRYDEIWDNAVFSIGKNDKKRVVKALKHISAGDDVGRYADMEELARYFAVNAFVLNVDNYLTNMAHNYYLYEKDGVLSMLPWDYDQTLGTIGAVGDAGSITDYINLPIDEPLMNTTLDQRPMLAAVLNDPEGKQLYYKALQTLLDEWVYSGRLESYLSSREEMIRPYAELDPILNGDMEKFDAAVQSVRDFCSLRARSIQGQLDGSIPATAAGQAAAPETLVDAAGYSSPDSGSFLDMLLPENADYGLEDIAERVLRQIDLISILKVLPVDELTELKDAMGQDSGGRLSRFEQLGLVRDPDRFRTILRENLADGLRPIAMVAVSILALAAALVWMRRYQKDRQPAARVPRKEMPL